ncbi:hypothetical protein V6N11_019908 [Hibiscus sabdariffa]|uniref:Tubby C-terminal domain-containing protein n=1 Tax=Hibiscus sabdariffa TaxID=183260 RepID=A0ABR2N9D5_9ROSI
MTIQCIARLRSRRVVQDQPEGSDTAKVEADGHGGCCWANLPHEMLREVLLRIEESGTRWPQRRNVVACAGVCKSWRFAIKEIVQVPQISGKLTFPISVKQPGPKDTLQCFIKRNRSTQTYYLYLGLTNALTDDGKFLLAACKWRRPICTDYIISLRSEDISKGSSTYVGKLRSNFLGTKFSVLDGQPLHAVAKMTKSRSSRLADLKQVSPRVPSRNHPTVHISYELNMLGSRCVLYDLQGSKENVVYFGYHPGNFDKTRENFVSEPFSGQKDGGALVLRNKSLRWHEQLQCWCLNFHGRVTVASVKNFQLVASPENGPAGPEHDKIILQFGKQFRHQDCLRINNTWSRIINRVRNISED